MIFKINLRYQSQYFNTDTYDNLQSVLSVETNRVYNISIKKKKKRKKEKKILYVLHK